MRTMVLAASRAASAAPLAAPVARSLKSPTVSRALFQPDVTWPSESSIHRPRVPNGFGTAGFGGVSGGGGTGSAEKGASGGGSVTLWADAAADNSALIATQAMMPAFHIAKERSVIRIPSLTRRRDARFLPRSCESPMAKMRTSKDINRYNHAGHQRSEADAEPEREPLLDDDARTWTIAMEQEGDEIEAHPARDDRQEDERDDGVGGEAGRDGDDLVGNRRQALEQDDPRSPFHIGIAERIDLGA